MKRIKNNRDGSALLIAIVVMLALTVLSLLLLTASYAVFSQTAGRSSDAQCLELAESALEELGRQLTETDVLPDSPDSLYRVLSGEDDSVSSLWRYLRFNLLQDSWPAGVSGESGQEDAAVKSFSLEPEAGSEAENKLEESGAEITVTMTCEKDAESGAIWLVIRTACSIGKKSSEASARYQLTITDFGEDVSEDYPDPISADENPLKNSVNLREDWSFSEVGA